MPPHLLSRRHVPGSPLRFDPDDRITSAILEDLALPASSLASIAHRANTTLEALMLWMARPDIATRIAAITHGYATRATLCMLACAPSIVAALSRSLHEYHAAESELRGLNSHQAIALACRNRAVNNDTTKLMIRYQQHVEKYLPASFAGACTTPATGHTPATGAESSNAPAPTPTTPPATTPNPAPSHIQHPTSNIASTFHIVPNRCTEHPVQHSETPCQPNPARPSP